MIKNGWPVVILISLATEPRYILNFFISVEFTGPSLNFLISRYHSIAPKSDIYNDNRVRKVSLSLLSLRESSEWRARGSLASWEFPTLLH